ncbi:MAG: PEP-CTERM sorting domain-containing protein [Planctomycetaceae bacterium]|nr:PEP-CTERM sorting domain-containing protein [Planctomycetaceae bacterium]
MASLLVMASGVYADTLTAADIADGVNGADETWQFAAQAYAETARFRRDTDYDNDPASWWGGGWSGWRYPNNEGEGVYGNTGTGAMLMHPWNSGAWLGSTAIMYRAQTAGTYTFDVSIYYAGGGNGVGANVFLGEDDTAGYVRGINQNANGFFSVGDPGDSLAAGVATTASRDLRLASSVTLAAGQYLIFALDNNITWGADMTTLNHFIVTNDIPEPASLMLLAAGAVGVIIRRRRK